MYMYITIVYNTEHCNYYIILLTPMLSPATDANECDNSTNIDISAWVRWLKGNRKSWLEISNAFCGVTSYKKEYNKAG